MIAARAGAVAALIVIGLPILFLLVQAGLLLGDSNAYNDGAGPWPGPVPPEGSWTGKAEFRAMVFEADVEFCVYAPGDFDNSFPGQDPSTGTDYVYAYQIFNDLDFYPPPPFSGAVRGLSVGINGGDEIITHVGSIPGTGDQSPQSDDLNSSSVWWIFGDAYELDKGEISDILFFTTPGVPEWDYADMDGGFPDTGQLPSPQGAPEPGTLALLAVAGLLLKAGRRR